MEKNCEDDGRTVETSYELGHEPCRPAEPALYVDIVGKLKKKQ